MKGTDHTFINDRWGALPRLRDEVIEIGPFAARDVAAMMEWNHDQAAQRWFDWPLEPPPASDHRRHCLEVLGRWEADYAAGRRVPFAVRLLSDLTTAGSVELSQVGDEWHVSFLTHPAHRGHGVAARAVRLACEWVFGAPGAKRVHLWAARENAGSIRVADKAGFQPSGRRSISEPVQLYEPDAGQRRDMIEFVLDSA